MTAQNRFITGGCSELSLRRPVKTNFHTLTACKHLILIQKLDVTPLVVHSVFPALNALNAAYVEPRSLEAVTTYPLLSVLRDKLGINPT